MDYQSGFEQLRSCLKERAPTLVATLATLEDRFRNNQQQGRDFGATAETRSEHAQIIHALNDLALVNCGVSFSDLCERKPPLVVPQVAQPKYTLLWRVTIVAIAIVFILPLALLLYFSAKPMCCFALIPDVDFESGTNEGWDSRFEGENVLGTEAVPDNERSCFGGRWSLRFSFDLREAPFDKAQVKYETLNLQLKHELSGQVYVPTDAPADLRVSCFALEDNRGNRWPGKPEWPWYQTNDYPLTPNRWNEIHCSLADFAPTYPYPVGHIDEPLLVGFEITRQSRLPYQGEVFLDNTTLR